MADYSYKILIILVNKMGTAKVARRKNNIVVNKISVNIPTGNSIRNTVIEICMETRLVETDLIKLILII